MLIIFCLSSCASDGDIGPEGPQGEKGEPGKNGATVLNGSEDPTPDLGNIGDFYINTSNYVLYGPKTDTGWEDGQSVLGAKGEQGDKGDPGEATYVLLSGSANPDANSGEIGDFYYNTSTKTLFYHNGEAWEMTAKLASTIQFTKTGVNLGSNSPHVIRFNLPFNVFQNSMVHVYALRRSTTNTWHPLPGYMDSANSFRIEYSGGAITTALAIFRVTGSRVFANSIIRIVVTEADRFEAVSKVVDFNDYDAVSRYFDLETQSSSACPDL